jgi:predicted nuclease with TOPRIM domain
MSDGVSERLGELEAAVRRAGEAIGQLREESERLRGENERFREETERLKGEVARLADERRQSLAQIDAILKDIAKLGLG